VLAVIGGHACEARDKTLLVDADLRTPGINRRIEPRRWKHGPVCQFLSGRSVFTRFDHRAAIRPLRTWPRFLTGAAIPPIRCLIIVVSYCRVDFVNSSRAPYAGT